MGLAKEAAKRLCSMLKGPAGLALAVGAWWTAVDSYPLWSRAFGSGAFDLGAGIRFVLSCGTGLSFAYAAALLLIGSVTGRRFFKFLLILLSTVGAGGFAFSLLYSAAMSPDMLRNAFATTPEEATDLFSPSLVFFFLLALLPPVGFVLWYPVAKRPISARLREVALAAAFLIAGAGVIATDLKASSFYFRGKKAERYYIAPVNVIYSAIKTQVKDEEPGQIKVRIVVDSKPVLSPAPKPGDRPLVVVVVTGETARAKNWGLSGYARDTTPELRKAGVVNFSNASSCGTSTDVSVPCMFSRVGRSDYNRKRILEEEPLPAVLQRAGVNVLWIDNQSGSKGASQGVPYIDAVKAIPEAEKARLCGKFCLDEAMLPPFDKFASGVKPGTVNAVFLHMMGSHGPAYANRYPENFEEWGPVCKKADVKSCDAKELRNAYDNSILYTDHILAALISRLKAKTDADTALVYMSDHGESLGEKGLYLHGAPYVIAPSEQTWVPAILWASDGFRARLGIAAGCLERNAGNEISHDNLWSTVLGLTTVKSSTYTQRFDVTAACRKPLMK